MTKIKVTINGKVHSYFKNVRLMDIANELKDDYKYPILIASVNNNVQELNTTLDKDAIVKFFDCSSRLGGRLYQKTIIFVLVYAIKQLFGYDKDIVVSYAIDKGLCISPNFDVSENDLIKLDEKMHEIVKSNLPITKMVVKKSEAIEYYKIYGDDSKINSLAYNSNSYITLYKLDNLYDFFYMPMPLTVGVYEQFEFKYLNDRNFVLLTPVSSLDGKIPEYVHHDKMFEAFNDYKEWSLMVGSNYVADINKAMAEDRIKDIIRMSEVVYNNQLLYLSKKIYEERDRIKMILIAGPSSSGKTTTSRKMALYFRGFGLNPKVISVDDYFLERKETPKKEDGSYDYESINALDLGLFNNHMAKLLSGEEIVMPTYDFITGKKVFNKKIKLGEKDILIIEGLHCLNEELTSSVAKENKYKIYISPLTELNIDSHNRISATDNRLLRRLVRDHRVRGYSVDEILKMWINVRVGEEKYVFPFQDEADFVINTATVYEIGVLKPYAEALLYTVGTDSVYYEDARRLLNLLRVFVSIPEGYVPDEAIIREFIGGGYYHD